MSLGSSLDLNPGLGNGQNSDTDFLSGLYCAGSASACHGICPNADLTGLGVRVAFWLSSIFQAFLVAISPRDSAPSTWTSTILTASVIIPALVQKSQGSLTLYHSTLVLNFASYSTLVSLAVAPMCSVWRTSFPRSSA
ncbi:hypothetical protein DL96DRAFT_1710892 [Flagelloscypha sp. PMI_526]|nr:hypothetical protein DL96DRAFT_1710892 [Flagelloscypha sp. PMI_526]